MLFCLGPLATEMGQVLLVDSLGSPTFQLALSYFPTLFYDYVNDIPEIDYAISLLRKDTF